jgi:hypothetical protein
MGTKKIHGHFLPTIPYPTWCLNFSYQMPLGKKHVNEIIISDPR